MGGGIRFTASGGCRRSGLPRASGAHRQVTPWHHHPGGQGDMRVFEGSGVGEGLSVRHARRGDSHRPLYSWGRPPRETRRDSEIVCAQSIILAAAYTCQMSVSNRRSPVYRLSATLRKPPGVDRVKKAFLFCSQVQYLPPAGGKNTCPVCEIFAVNPLVGASDRLRNSSRTVLITRSCSGAASVPHQ